MSQNLPAGDPEQVPQQPQAPQYAPPQYAAPQYVAPQQYTAAQADHTQQPAYQAAEQPYAVPYYVPVAAAAPPTNTLAILALISAFVAPFVVPVVLGHLSMNQIRRTGEGGRGLAVTALVLGYIQVAFWAILIAFIVWVGVIAAAGSSM
ncbi:DUF4190 domain-containing protein [Leucobacter chromiireducens]|uniref:DUF4190 domain-containing protein n=1 Tax=Leucobacter chromiireducens subsp. chromiireducens TaxID=660067 RepID=A0ABS1SLV8_9MICO|nr:DUF4190 domain-containing protein [Leucobacter chromiireducens subsp. chromiireducens]